MKTLVWIIVCLTHIAQAEILINNQPLPTNNGLYDISENLGQTVDNHLFHTFDSFSLTQGEIAQFSGSDSIQNIISRVIGGKPSFINGTIRSTIPNADFYFLNPNGLLFGEHAKLDLSGSFFASTADYLKFTDGGEFHARFPQQDILTVAPIASFGFLDNAAAAIQITDAQLAVASTKTLSLVAGDIFLTNTLPTTYNETSQHQFTHQLLAPSGHIILDSKNNINISNFGIDTSGLFGGQITIRGKNLTLNDSEISSHTFAELDGQIINIQVDNLSLQDSDTANQITIQDGGAINTSAMNAGGGNISLNIRDFLYLFDQGSITTSVRSGSCNSGNITIKNPKFLLMNHSAIIAQANAGQGGNIRIIANQFLKSSNSLVSASSRLGIDGHVEITSPNETVSSGLFILNKSFLQQTIIKDPCKAALIGQLPTEFQLPFVFKVNMYRFPNHFIEDWIPSSASILLSK